MELENGRHKLCFVTIGATAPFGPLLSNIFQESFFTALKEHGYTDLLVQHGKEGQAIYEQFAKDHPPEDPLRSGISVKGFTFNKRGLSQEMGFTKENKEMDYEEGMILSHAGSGTILEALRIGVPLVVVPNPDLQDNHQVQLAKELSKHGYVVASQVTDIASSIGKAERLRTRLHSWPPINSTGSNKKKRGLAAVMDDEMGFVD